MTTFHAERTGVERRRWWTELLVPEVCASITIGVIWLAVLFDAVFGPDIVSTNGAQMTTVPSAVVVALFAFLATGVIARHAFRRDRP
jgi:hypothetical protein